MKETTPAGREGITQMRRTLLPAETVRELSRLRPARVVRDTVLTWTLILAALAVAALADSWWVYVAAAVVVGNRYYALYIIGHDGLHRRLFPDRDRNDLFCDLFLLGPIGGITRINDRNHLRHHRFLGSDPDPDRHRHGCTNKATRGQLAAYLVALSSVATSVRNVFGPAGATSPSEGAEAAAPDRERHRPRDLLLLAAWQIVLFGGLTWAFGWWAYLALWWIPVFTFAFLGDNARSFVEHSHPEADVAADRHRLVTMRPSWLERQLFAPMEMYHHSAHHLWPSIPYYNLAAATTAMHEHPAAAAIEQRRSYIGYITRYARALPIVGCGDGATVG